jgi:hypothetical protein
MGHTHCSINQAIQLTAFLAHIVPMETQFRNGTCAEFTGEVRAEKSARPVKAGLHCRIRLSVALIA